VSKMALSAMRARHREPSVRASGRDRQAYYGPSRRTLPDTTAEHNDCFVFSTSPPFVQHYRLSTQYPFRRACTKNLPEREFVRGGRFFCAECSMDLHKIVNGKIRDPRHAWLAVVRNSLQRGIAPPK
jgi:hypothetical protein